MAAGGAGGESDAFRVVTSEDVLQNTYNMKEILRAPKLFEASNQVPSPGKDWCHIIVTERGAVWRKWKITLRNQSSARAPTEKIFSLDDLKLDTSIHSDIARIFGTDVLRQIQRIVSGCQDHLSRLPSSIMVRVVLNLDLQTIARLAQVNQHLREVCNSDQLWKKLYHLHLGPSTDEVDTLAQEMSWKKLFFMNKLQLQKELSRQRRNFYLTDPN